MPPRIGHGVADVTGPGLIGKDGSRFFQLGGDIDQNEIATLDGEGHFTGRRVVWVGAVGVNGDDSRLGDQTFLIPAADDELLDVVFGRRGAPGERLKDRLIYGYDPGSRFSGRIMPKETRS